MRITVEQLIEKKLVHEFHTSERRSFKACRRRWDWIFRQNYYPVVTAKPLEFGISFHIAMQHWYDPQYWTGDRKLVAKYAIEQFKAKCESQRREALKLVDRQYFDQDVETDYAERVELGVGMLNYYFTKVSPVLDIGWKPVFVEVPFMIPIKNPETGEKVIWCTCAQCHTKWLKSPYGIMIFYGLPVVYAGRIDMVAQEESTKKFLIFDWKTAANIPNDHQFLQLDDQIGSYVWAVRKLGVHATGFVYHEQRKGFPEAPALNKTRRLGCIYSVNKNQNTDYETYLKTVQENDTDAWKEGKYESMLVYLRNEGVEYYHRERINKTTEELVEIEQNIGYEVLDMIEPKIRIYPSAGRFGCQFCAFREPCIEKNTKSDYTYLLNTMFEKREHYYVRQEPSTESKGGE